MLNKLLFFFALAFVLGSAGASAGQQDTIWSVRTGNNEVKDCHFTPSGDSVIAIAGDSLYIFQTSTGSILKKSFLPFSTSKFRLFHYSTKMAIVGYGGPTFIWDYAADTIIAQLLPLLSTLSLDISPDDLRLIIGTSQYYGFKIMVYDLQQKTFTDSIDAGGSVVALSISPDGQYLASSAHTQDSQSGHDYDKLILRQIGTWEIIKDFDPTSTEGIIKDIKFSPDSKYIGIAKWDGTVKVYRTDSLDLHRDFVVYQGFSNGPIRVCFSNNSQFIYSGLFNYFTTKLWNIENNELIYTYNCVSVYGLDVTVNEKIVAGSGYDVNLLAPKFLSVSDPLLESNEQPTGFIISKSNNQALTLKSSCNNLENCRLYDVFGNLIQYDNILSFSDNGNISINPVQLGTGVYFLAVGMERVVKVMVVE
jgi:WD40 repeat protein